MHRRPPICRRSAARACWCSSRNLVIARADRPAGGAARGRARSPTGGNDRGGVDAGQSGGSWRARPVARLAASMFLSRRSALFHHWVEEGRRYGQSVFHRACGIAGMRRRLLANAWSVRGDFVIQRCCVVWRAYSAEPARRMRTASGCSARRHECWPRRISAITTRCCWGSVRHAGAGIGGVYAAVHRVGGAAGCCLAWVQHGVSIRLLCSPRQFRLCFMCRNLRRLIGAVACHVWRCQAKAKGARGKVMQAIPSRPPVAKTDQKTYK